jgi:hypothetical protein
MARRNLRTHLDPVQPDALKVVGYVRVSSGDQAENGVLLPEQERRILARPAEGPADLAARRQPGCRSSTENRNFTFLFFRWQRTA